MDKPQVPLRIAAVLTAYPPVSYKGNVGGGVISNRILFEALVQKGHRVVVYCLNDTRRVHDGFKNEYNGVSVYNIRALFSVGSLGIFLSEACYRFVAASLIRKHGADLILCATQSVASANFCAKKTGLKAGAFIRAFENFACKDKSSVGGFFKKIKSFVHRLALGSNEAKDVKKLDFLLVNSHFVKMECQKEFGDLLSEIIYPPVFVDMPRSFDVKKQIKNILMVGTSEKKGVNLFKNLSKKFLGLNFIIVGDPNIPSGKAVSIGNLNIYGWINDVEEYMELADCVLVPSQCEEAFGRVAVEALLQGKIVLVSDRGGLPESVGFKEDLIVRHDDVDEWSHRLEKVLKETAFFMKCCEDAQIKLSAYGAVVQVDKVESFLHGVRN